MALKPNLKIDIKSPLRWIVMKTIGVIVSVIFSALGLILLGYSLTTVVTSVRGVDAKVVTVSTQVGKCQTAWRVGGLFQVSALIEKQKHEKIYCLYPAWPDQLQPTKGDILEVWPEKQPFVGAPYVEGWGWFLIGTLFVLGLVMLEFAFIALTLR